MNLMYSLILLIFMHPLHVTLTNIEYDATQEKCEITIKIFSDDFETVLEKHSGQDITINAENETQNIVQIINTYIASRFSIIFDDEKSAITYISKRYNHEATWLTFEVATDSFSKMHIKNELLTDLFNDQTNLVIFKNGEYQRGYNLNNRKTEIEIKNK